MKTKVSLLLVPVLLMALDAVGGEVPPTNSATIGFNVPPLGKCQFSIDRNYFEQGMAFGQRSPSSYGIKRYGPGYTGSPDNGSTFMIWDNAQMPIAFSLTDGSTFGLYSFDLAEDTVTVIPDVGSSLQPMTAHLRGFKADGTVLDTSFTTDGWNDGIGGKADFETFHFGAEWFSGLTEAEFVNDGLQKYAVDNLVFLREVPEPGPIALLALGGAILALWRRVNSANPRR